MNEARAYAELTDCYSELMAVKTTEGWFRWHAKWFSKPNRKSKVWRALAAVEVEIVRLKREMRDPAKYYECRERERDLQDKAILLERKLKLPGSERLTRAENLAAWKEKFH